MEDKKLTISVSTFLLIISIIVIMVMSVYIFIFSENNKQLTEEITQLQEEKESIQTKLNSYKDTLYRLISSNMYSSNTTKINIDL